ncbi:MAG TPA: LysM peptidoglycan-binding domain-containing protein, partial [Xanthomonadaceae bacterium]|nr:LysM peptidoglycan-binding domain-containing protein [Xanthomonadaceae bacterium]
MERLNSIGTGAVLVLALLATGCGGGRSVVVEPAPGVTRPARPAPPARSEYVVARGDTLYQIAFRHGLDYRDVARWNGIGPPYTIYPGQRIRLAADGRSPPPSPARTAAGPTTQPQRPPSAPARPSATATPT